MEYCCYVREVALSCYLDMLDKLWKWICWNVCPTFAAFSESLAQRPITAILKTFLLVLLW